MNRSISCGNCKGTHETPDQVRACYGHVNVATLTVLPAEEDDLLPCERKAIETGKARPVPTPDPITMAQEAFLNRLLAERPMLRSVENLFPENVAKMTKADASRWISEVKAMPKETNADSQAPVVALEDGVYRKNGVITMVYHTVHGANVQVGKVLHVHQADDGSYTGEFVYGAKAALKGLTPADRLSQADAAQFGSVYGFCCRCARTLTQEESKHVGYGATCAAHEGWWYPTKVELRNLKLTSS